MLGRESGLFFSIRSPLADQRTPCRHFTVFKKLSGFGITFLQVLGASKGSSKVGDEILPELFNDRDCPLLKNAVMGSSKINYLPLLREHKYVSTKDARNLTLYVLCVCTRTQTCMHCFLAFSFCVY